MSSSHSQTRQERIDAEMRLLRILVNENSSSIKIVSQDKDSITLHLIVGSYVVKHARSYRPSVENKHQLRIAFPQDYPANETFKVRIEPLLFHPNIRSDGQWEVKAPHVIDYIYRLWEYYTFQRIDQSMSQIQNLQALDWYKTSHPSLIPNQVLHPVDLAASSIDGQPSAVSATPPAENTPGSEAYEGAALRRTESASAATRPAETPRSDTRAQGGGFRVKNPVRVTRPREWRFPNEFWQNGTRKQYRNWSYSVPGYPSEGHKQLKVVILETALHSILQHARGDTRNERFGILVGGLFSQPQSEEMWVEIVAMLPAERVNANIASVEVSTEEINRLNVRVDTILAETQEAVRKIGWYHTHPGHGIFMSGTDRTNQRLCYGADWQVALVVDPLRRHYGAFHGADCTSLFDGLLVLSEQEALRLQTPAYRAWREIEEHIAVPARLALSPEEQADPPQQRPLYDGSANAAPLASHLNRQQEPGYLAQPRTFRERVFWELGKTVHRSPFLSVLMAFALIIIFWLLFSLVRSSGALASTEFQSGQQIKAMQQLSREHQSDQQQIGMLQQRLTAQSTQAQNAQKQLQSMQQDLFTQVAGSDLKTSNPVMYKTILKMIVAIGPETESGKKATILLTEDLTYVVAAGDTLASIAQRFGVSIQVLSNANPEVKPEQLQPGQALKIPGATA